MPNKYPEKKGWDVPKQKYRVSNWSDYNESLRSRGDITVWLSDDAIENWYQKKRIYDGTGTPKLYTDFAIITCHEIRQVYRLPLRQCQGFVDSLFKAKGLPITCPDYTSLSKRLKELNIQSPQYAKTDCPDENVHAIAIDSTGLKRFGRGEWHQEKYELSNKASWRKLHVGVNEKHYFEACVLTDRFGSDEAQIPPLLDQIEQEIDHLTADGAYDKAPVYDSINDHSPGADVIIPPRDNAILRDDASPWRNRNLLEIKILGRMQWQKQRHYGQRNYSELAVQRYQKILGNRGFAPIPSKLLIGVNST
jgi:hypothetical protein